MKAAEGPTRPTHRITAGVMRVNRTRPGLGIEVKFVDLEKAAA